MTDLEATGKGRNIKRPTIAAPRETDIVLNRIAPGKWCKPDMFGLAPTWEVTALTRSKEQRVKT